MTNRDPKCAIEIVLVDDDWADREIARRVFGSQANACKLRILSDGPDLVLMDINMPRISGIEVLRSIKADKALQHTPVLMLTTSSLEYWMQVATLPYSTSREQFDGGWVLPGGFL